MRPARRDPGVVGGMRLGCHRGDTDANSLDHRGGRRRGRPRLDGQGLGILRGSSPMVDDVRWAIDGLGLMGIGAVVGWTALRSRRRT